MGRGLAAQGSAYCGRSGDKCSVTSRTPALGEWEGLLGAGLRFPWMLWTEGQELEQMAPSLSPAGGLHRARGKR